MAVSCRLLPAEALVRSQVSPYEFCGGQSGSGTVFSPSTSVFLLSVSIISPMIQSLHVPVAPIRRIRWAKPRNLPKCNSLSAVGEHWIEKCSHFFCALEGSNNESSTQASVWVWDISVGIAT